MFGAVDSYSSLILKTNALGSRKFEFGRDSNGDEWC